MIYVGNYKIKFELFELVIPELGTSTSSASQGPVNYIEKNYATLSSFLPDVSTIFLREKAWNIGDAPDMLEELIRRALEDKSGLPLKKD